MDDVVYLFTVILCCDTVHDVLRPKTFPPFRFWGVTDWYQSIVYSELSISTHKRDTNYKPNAIKTMTKSLYF